MKGKMETGDVGIWQNRPLKNNLSLPKLRVTNFLNLWKNATVFPSYIGTSLQKVKKVTVKKLMAFDLLSSISQFTIAQVSFRKSLWPIRAWVWDEKLTESLWPIRVLIWNEKLTISYPWVSTFSVLLRMSRFFYFLPSNSTFSQFLYPTW